jgi:Domain of unknown function (DUF6468)
MSQGLGVIVDCIVAILLVLTIGYCMMLNRRLKLLKADEQSLRATISELVTATEIAERAIGGLKITVHECDMGLGERLRKAERLAGEIDRAVVSGKDLISRLLQIVSAGRRAEEPLFADEVKSSSRNEIRFDAKADAKIDAKIDAKADSKTDHRIDAKAVAAAAEAFAERLRLKVHGLAA